MSVSVLNIANYSVLLGQFYFIFSQSRVILLSQVLQKMGCHHYLPYKIDFPEKLDAILNSAHCVMTENC